MRVRSYLDLGLFNDCALLFGSEKDAAAAVRMMVKVIEHCHGRGVRP